MRILLHLCCGPCGITVIQRLAAQGHEVRGFFFNPNIHPLAEYLRRREGAAAVAARLGIPLIFADELPLGDQVWRDPWRERETPTPLPRSAAEGKAPRYPLPPAADPAPWLRAVAGREYARCLFFWRVRLRKTAEMAAALGCDAFSSSLLYSRYQNHEAIRELGEGLSAELGIPFVYEDFRLGWQEGIRLSKEWGVYRQQYCGCVFSEYERYARDFARLREGGGSPTARG
jgi:predicted adenine nucleotide alpha hydrolase (AANH) superfamily ATPase